jgi:uncharacterized protein
MSYSLKCKAIVLLSLFFLCSSDFAHGQNTKPAIHVISKVNPDGVWLRWAPAEFETWKLGNIHGYHIERFTIKKDGSIDPKEVTRLTTSRSIKPLSREAFQKADNPDQVAAVGELIYTAEATDAKQKSDNPSVILQRKDDQNNQFGMALLLCDLSYKTAEAAGLFFNDHTAEKGDRYIYKITVANTLDSTKDTEAGVVVVDMIETPPLKPFNDLHAEFKDQTVTLNWPTFTHKGVYGAYIIEKSTDGKLFYAATDLPYMTLTESTVGEEAHFVDSLKSNGITYYYRVLGITPFGEKGPPSNIVSGAGKDVMTGSLSITELTSTGKQKLLLKWNFPLPYEKKINGFKIKSASKADGKYSDITKKEISRKDRQLTLDIPSSSGYFIVTATDKNGADLVQSFPYFFHVEDNSPPAAPSGISGTIDKKGKIMLSWSPAKEADLLGYRVFSAHHINEEFTERTTTLLSTPSFSDSINTNVLNKKVAFKIIAVDQNYNTSSYSAPYVIPLPDHVSPAPPVFTKAKVAPAKGIELEWIPSVSSDVARYELIRMSSKDTMSVFAPNRKENKFENKFTDTQITAGTTYRYKIMTYDSAENLCTVLSKEIVYEPGIRKEVTDFSAAIDRDNKVIILTWKYDAPAVKCILYRKKNDEAFSLYQALPFAPTEFSDKLVTLNNTYTYKIQLVFNSGVKTELSKELKVPY